MIWLQRHASTVLFSTFGISFVLMIICIILFLYYVFVSFADGYTAHPKYVIECSIMILGFFGAANGMILFRLFGHSATSFVFHALIELTITLFVLMQMGLFFNAKGWKLFYYTFPLPAFIMIACFLLACVFALYKAVCTTGSVRLMAQALHGSLHGFLGVTTLVIMFWNVTLVLAMMCINPKHNQSISEINYEDLLLEPSYIAMLVLIYMLLVLFIVLIPFLKSKKCADDTEYDVPEIENYSTKKNVLSKGTQKQQGLEDDGDEVSGYEEDGVDGDDELGDDEYYDAQSVSGNVTKPYKKRRLNVEAEKIPPRSRRRKN